MRIEVVFIAEEPITLSWNYLDALRGIFYRAIEQGIPRVAREVHDEGLLVGGKRYKLATFSLLHPERYEKSAHGLRTRGLIRWWIASPLESVIEALALGLLAYPQVHLGRARLMVGQVGVLLPPAFTEAMTFETLSPIFVATGERTADGRFRSRYLAPEDPDFVRVLSENLRRKAHALWGEALEGDLQFEWLGVPRSKLLSVNGTEVRGWMMRFRVRGPIPLIQLGYDAGLGSRTAQGFGMVREVREARPPDGGKAFSESPGNRREV